MWNDNVTDRDFLGFDVHVNLIKELIKDDNMLPLTIGLFGDWGSGKSSILEILKKDFDNDEKTVCLYFNGWMFEGYDDAKAALLESIVKCIEKNKKFGDVIHDNITKLLKSIKWMRVIGFSFKNIAVPALSALATGGLSIVPQLLDKLQSLAQNPTELAKIISECNVEKFKERFIKTSDEGNNFDLVREFRDEFEKMLEKSKVEKLVILIDDLDRCLPDRIIDNLEAVKLFLNVKNTTFIIGADPRIVRHAIEYRYNNTNNYDRDNNGNNNNDRIINDYLEKLIQIPYSLPKLSDAEVETYITLLFCENDLPSEEDFKQVLTAFKKYKEKDRYSVFNFSEIKKILGSEKTGELENHVSLIAKLSPMISETLYGNPRQIKRFLNTFMLRKKLAEVSNINDFRDDVLAKLMILEYSEPMLFDKLYSSQIINSGIATELVELEKSTKSKSIKSNLPKEWNKPKLLNWLSSEPVLSKYDLRDYFWISRDRLSSIQSNQLISPIVKSLLSKLEPENMPVKVTEQILQEELLSLNTIEQSSFFGLLKQRTILEPTRKRFYDIFNKCLDADMDCISFYVDTLTSVEKSISPAIREALRRYNTKYPELNKFVAKKTRGK
jgi:predicted KAP-like P-loop ATPase